MMKSAVDEVRETLAPPQRPVATRNPDAPSPAPPPILRLTEEQRRAREALRAKWRIKFSRCSPAAREAKRVRDRERMRRKRAKVRSTPALTGQALRDNRLCNLEKAHQVTDLLRRGIDPATRISTRRTKPYSDKWQLKANPPVAKLQGVKPAPFLERKLKEAEARALAAKTAPSPKMIKPLLANLLPASWR